MNDSTPLIHELERRYPDRRSILPADKAQAFLAFLLEDMADEWGTKAMFHYRWFRERDQLQMSRWIMFDRLKGRGRDAVERAAETFRARQTSRMALVGCTPQNAPILEESAARLFALFDELATDEGYLFGGRPSLADFGWFGQLSQLAVDPTPSDLMRGGPRPAPDGRRDLPAVPGGERPGRRGGSAELYNRAPGPALLAGRVQVSGPLPGRTQSRLRSALTCRAVGRRPAGRRDRPARASHEAPSLRACK